MTDELAIGMPQKLGPLATAVGTTSDEGGLPAAGETGERCIISQAMTPSRTPITAATVMRIAASLRRAAGPLAGVVSRRERRPLPESPLLATMPASSSRPVPLDAPSDLGLCWKSVFEPAATVAESRTLAGTV